MCERVRERDKKKCERKNERTKVNVVAVCVPR